MYYRFFGSKLFLEEVLIIFLAKDTLKQNCKAQISKNDKRTAILPAAKLGVAELGVEAGAVPGVLSLIFSLSPVGVAAGVESGFEGGGFGGRLSLDSESESSVEASSGHSLNSILFCLSQSRSSVDKRCAFNKHTVKVCVSCF